MFMTKVCAVQQAKIQKKNRLANDQPRLGNICISMVKNEQDIIEPFIRHNVRFFDLMFVLDNGSSDATRDILMKCAQEFDTLCVSDLPHRHYAQGDFMTKAMHFVQAGCFANYIAFLDADEFIDAPDRATFDVALSTIPVGGFGLLDWSTLLPDPNLAVTRMDDFLMQPIWRRRAENPQYSKGILRAGGMTCSDVIVEQGNHGFRTSEGKKLASVRLKTLPLLHFPIRSSNQALAKGVIGWQANLARKNAPAQAAYQWKRIYDLHEAGQKTFDTKALADEAMAYAQHKTPKSWEDNATTLTSNVVNERRYSNGQSASLSLLLRDNATARQAAHYIPKDRKTVSDAVSPIDHAFDDQWHWDHFFLDIPPFQFVLEKYHTQSCLDIGCGTGVLLDYMRSMGVDDIYGVDGIHVDSTILSDAEYERVDVEKP